MQTLKSKSVRIAVAATFIGLGALSTTTAGAAESGHKSYNKASASVQLVHGPRPHWDKRHHGPRHGMKAHRMNRKEVRRSLRRQGFRNIRILDARGQVYVVKAVSFDRVPMRMVVDASNGRVMRMRPAGHGFHWSYRW